MNRDLSILLIMMLILPTPSISDTTSLNVDMVVILHSGAQFHREMLKTAILPLGSNLAQVFDFGDDKTRVALVATDTKPEPPEWHVFTPLTGSLKDFNDSMSKVDFQKWLDPQEFSDALKLAREEVFVDDATRPRVIFIISQEGHMETTTEVQREGKLLRDAGVVIYVLNHKDDNEMVATFRELVGNPDNLHQVDKIDHALNVALLEKVKMNLTCQFCCRDRWKKLDACTAEMPLPFTCPPCPEKMKDGKKTKGGNRSSAPLVLGIVIPIVFILIVAAGLVVLWKRKKNRSKLTKCAACATRKKKCEKCIQRRGDVKHDESDPWTWRKMKVGRAPVPAPPRKNWIEVIKH